MVCDVCGEPAERCYLCETHLEKLCERAYARAKADNREAPTEADFRQARDDIELQ